MTRNVSTIISDAALTFGVRAIGAIRRRPGSFLCRWCEYARAG